MRGDERKWDECEKMMGQLGSLPLSMLAYRVLAYQESTASTAWMHVLLLWNFVRCFTLKVVWKIMVNCG